MLAHPLQEPPPPALLTLGMAGETVASRIGEAGEFLPDQGDQTPRLRRLHLDPVPAQNLGVDLPEARDVDHGMGDVEGDGLDHAARISEARASLERMRSPTLRVTIALVLFSSWIALLFAGFAFGGSIHLVLGAALILFPWRAVTTSDR